MSCNFIFDLLEPRAAEWVYFYAGSLCCMFASYVTVGETLEEQQNHHRVRGRASFAILVWMPQPSAYAA